MQAFSKIHARAVARKGSKKAVEEQLPNTIKSTRQLCRVGDDRFLAGMTRAIFQAGFSWQVIANKWPGFEEAFWQFNISRCAFISPDDEDALLKDTRIVRNYQKIATVAKNARLIADVADEHGSFARFVAHWPDDDFAGLLKYLHKHGSRLGGSTSQYFLRFIGKDGFVLSKDGVAALIESGVIDRNPTSQTNMRKVQQAYNQWREESGLSTAAISRILAMSTGSG